MEKRTNPKVKCWNCGARNLEEINNYSKCQNCGATWNEIPTVGPDILERDSTTLLSPNGSLTMRINRPSPSVKRRSARARKAKAP